MFKQLINVFGSHAASSLKRKDQWSALLASFLAMLLIASICFWLAPAIHPLILVASLGPSIVLIFIVPNSPFSQPYTLLAGHLVCALIGVGCAYLPLDLYWSAAIGITTCMFAMFLFDCVHPPAAATAMMPIIVGPEAVNGFHFAYFPVLSNMIALVVLAILFHRYWLQKEYPQRSTPTEDPVHKHKDASPLVRLGIHPNDLEAALKEFDAYLNITEKDLTLVYGLAQKKAYTRKFGEIRCKHIMSHDVITVSADTPVEDAWALLQKHKIKVLPVVDQQRNVTGVISIVDFIKHVNPQDHDEFIEDLGHFVTPGVHKDNNPRHVGQIMVSPVFTVNHYDLIASLVPLLSDKGMHHIPVVNDEHKLVGIVTQSDLIAALYSGSLHQRTVADLEQ